MLENLIILASDIQITMAFYWEKHLIFSIIFLGFLGIWLVESVYSAGKQLVKVLFDKT
jgi:hypothetical protein